MWSVSLEKWLNKLKITCLPIKKMLYRKKYLPSGMSVLELLIAITILMVFTGVVVAVMEVTLRFAGEAECSTGAAGARICNDSNTKDVADGVLIDRVRIESLFDQMEKVLIQPGVDITQLSKISTQLIPDSSLAKCIPAPPPTDPGNYLWTSDIPELPALVDFPLGYRLWLWSTRL